MKGAHYSDEVVKAPTKERIRGSDVNSTAGKPSAGPSSHLMSTRRANDTTCRDQLFPESTECFLVLIRLAIDTSAQGWTLASSEELLRFTSGKQPETQSTIA
jgi:hypothetical protein